MLIDFRNIDINRISPEINTHLCTCDNRYIIGVIIDYNFYTIIRVALVQAIAFIVFPTYADYVILGKNRCCTKQ